MAAHTAPRLRTILTLGVTAPCGQQWVLGGRTGKRGRGGLAQAPV